ncbi:MAG: hypothetical protein AAF293_04920 [Pseudomonadota bacterium]
MSSIANVVAAQSTDDARLVEQIQVATPIYSIANGAMGQAFMADRIIFDTVGATPETDAQVRALHVQIERSIRDGRAALDRFTARKQDLSQSDAHLVSELIASISGTLDAAEAHIDDQANFLDQSLSERVLGVRDFRTRGRERRLVFLKGEAAIARVAMRSFKPGALDSVLSLSNLSFREVDIALMQQEINVDWAAGVAIDPNADRDAWRQAKAALDRATRVMPMIKERVDGLERYVRPRFDTGVVDELLELHHQVIAARSALIEIYGGYIATVWDDTGAFAQPSSNDIADLNLRKNTQADILRSNSMRIIDVSARMISGSRNN